MLILCLLLIFIKVVKDERSTCMQNPISYGIKNIEETSGYSFRCMCTSSKPNSIGVVFTSNGTEQIKVVSSAFTSKPLNINLTG